MANSFWLYNERCRDEKRLAVLQAAFNYPAEQVKAPYSLLSPPARTTFARQLTGGAPSAPLCFPVEEAVMLAAVRPSLPAAKQGDRRSLHPLRLFAGEADRQTAVFHSTDKKSGRKGNLPPPPQNERQGS